ncbi:MAG: oligoendopeptidase F [Candidatus Nanohaloarchaea archaeon]
MVDERSEIGDEYKWDLEDMYSSEEEWSKEFKQVKGQVEDFDKFEGTTADSPERLNDVLEERFGLDRRIENLKKYAFMLRDQDTREQKPRELVSKIKALNTEFEKSISFIEPEIVQNKSRVENWLEEGKVDEYSFYLNDLFRMKQHKLTYQESRILASLGDVTDAAHETYSILTNADLTFPEVERPEGDKVELTQGNFTKFMKHQDREFREKVFQEMYGTFSNYRNTITTTLEKNVNKNVREAEIKDFDSARQASTKPDKISESVNDNLIEAVRENLDLFQRHLELKEKTLGLEELEMHDIYMPVADSESPEIEYEDAKEHILEALKPLGEDYVEQVREGLENGWVDVYENKGKRSGAYSGGSYDSKPYILLNYQNDVSSMFTLAHELGHSMHSKLSSENQAYHESGYTIFQAEVASTTNEALLTKHLLETVEDKEFRMHVLSYALEKFRGTVFRQTMFSEFEKWIHEEIESGEALSPDKLDEKYLELKKNYYQRAEVGNTISREWMRIPHFYYNFYVYKYATGLSAGTVLSQKILEEGPEDYLDFLEKGGSQYSLESLKEAGADLTTSRPVEKAMEEYEMYLEKAEEEIS